MARRAPLPRSRRRLASSFITALTAALTVTLAAAAGARPASAAEVTLHEVRLPEKGTVDVPFVATSRAPADATLSAEARAEGPRARVELSFRRMKPAILLGGDVTTFAVWAVTREGLVENLGELFVKEPKGTATFTVARTAFALLVTAEAWPGVARPSELVVFAGGVPKPSEAASKAFALGGLAPAAPTAVPSLASVEWKGAEPVELVQARALLAQAEKAKAGDPDLSTLREARSALAEAEDPARRGSAAAFDAARRASALSGAAIREVLRRRAAEEAARLDAERVAREEARKAAALDEAERRRQAEASLAEVEELRQKAALEVEQTRQATAALAAAQAQAEGERQRLGEEKAALERERAEFAARVAPALEKVAPTTAAPFGLVLTFPGTSFDSGRATLAPSARVALGKLAGILLMAPDRNVRVEAHTDSSGSPAANRKLSEERARVVARFLEEQGVAPERISFEGYGPDLPVAPNKTAEGRALNRRVEIVVAAGTIEPAPREAAHAPE